MNILGKIGILGAIVLLASGFALVWIGEEKPDINGKKNIKSFPSQRSSPARMEEIHFLEKVEDQKTWELEAKSAEVEPEEDIVLMEDIRASFYTLEKDRQTNSAVREESSSIPSGEAGEMDAYMIKVKADSGRINRRTKEMVIAGNVELVRNDGMSILTQTLKWNDATREIRTNDSVNIRSGNMEIKGNGLVSQVDISSMRVMGPVKAFLYR